MTQARELVNLQVGDPLIDRGIATFPLFPREQPQCEYLTLDEAIERGLAIHEVSASGSVPSVLVENPLESLVLLYDGEELVGAKQNRILNVSILVGASSTLKIPVSCVEERRWHHSGRSFAAAMHAAPPELRRRKAETLFQRPFSPGAAQGEVWDAIRARAERMAVNSTTGAIDDAFTSYRRDLDQLEASFPYTPGQSGALVAVGNSYCLDWVSQPPAFACLWPKLRRGYLLDALEATAAADRDGALRFLDGVLGATATRQPSVGLGTDIRLRGSDSLGSGLECDSELLQLCAFSTDQGPRAARIARPSYRRR